MNKILVVGGCGFIGSHLVERLIENGHKVSVLVRKNSDIRFIQTLGVELFIGDLLVPDSLSPAFNGIDTVFCLVNVKPAGKSQEAYVKELNLVHTDGTLNLLAVCKLNKVERLVYLSSVAAIGYKKNVVTYNELSPEEPIDAYGRAKLEAENILRQGMLDSGVKITILQPPGVFGERGLGSLGKIIAFTEKGLVPVLGSGKNRQSLAYVGNVVNQLIFAAEHLESAGKTYIISDERPYTVNELIQAVSGAIGARPLKAHIPLWIVFFMVSTLNFFARLFLRRDVFNKESIIAVSTERIFDGSRIFRELGYKQVYDLASGVSRMVAWHKNKRP